MGGYNRSTREMILANVSPDTMNVINKHLEQYNLGSILDDALICIESNHEKIKKGMFSGPGAKMLKVTVILTPRWVIEVYKSDNDAPFARSAQLKDITVSDWEKDPMYAKMPDTGVNVTGRFTDTSESSSSFFGLGKDAAGDKFKEIFIKAVQDAKK